MIKTIYISLLLITIPVIVNSQGIRDTVFHIRQVSVSAEKMFNKEEAGIKSTGVDSLVLREKINLSLSELLSENTSVFIKNHGRGALATASFRGTSASHTQVTWNGISINSPMTGMTDFSLIPVYIIDEVNLKHGTGSISEMNGGLGGSVNLANKIEWEDGFDFKYLQGIGSYRSFDEFIQLGGGNSKIQARTRVYNNHSKNNFTFINRGIAQIDPATGEIISPVDTNAHAGYMKYGLLQEVYFRPGAKNILSLKYWGQAAERTIPRATSYEGPDNSNLNKQDSHDHKVVASWKHYGNKETLELISGISVKQLNYYLINQVPGLGELPAVYSLSDQNSFLNHVTYTHDFNDKFSIKTRIDFNVHDVSSIDTVTMSGYEEMRKELLSMVSIQRNFMDRLNVNLVVREDLIDNQFLPPVPFAGFDFKVVEKLEWIIKGNIARNYHMPSLNDLYWQPGGNPDLLPEKGVSGEIGTEFRMISEKADFQSELTLFRSDIDNWILWVPSYKGYWEPRNVRNVLSSGAELSAGLHGKTEYLNYRISGTYTYTKSINYGDPEIWGDDSYGKQLVYVPVHSGNFYVNLERNGYSVTWQHNSFGERYTTSSNDVTRRDWLYPYFMNDLILAKDFSFKKFNFSTQLKVYNLFNETYHSVLYRPMPGRNFMLVLLFRM